MDLDPLERAMVSEFRALLERELGDRLKEVRVFGSRARGHAHASSDLDVFVLIDERDRETWKRISWLSYDVMEAHDFALHLAPFVCGEAQFEHLKARERRIAQDIEREGIPV